MNSQKSSLFLKSKKKIVTDNLQVWLVVNKILSESLCNNYQVTEEFMKIATAKQNHQNPNQLFVKNLVQLNLYLQRLILTMSRKYVPLNQVCMKIMNLFIQRLNKTILHETEIVNLTIKILNLIILTEKLALILNQNDHPVKIVKKKTCC